MKNEVQKSKVKRWIMLMLLVAVITGSAFWIRDGQDQLAGTTSGLNTLLPKAHFKKRDSTKMSFYAVGEKQPRPAGDYLQTAVGKEGESGSALDQLRWQYDPAPVTVHDANEAKVYQKIAQIEKQLRAPDIRPAKTFKKQRPELSANEVERMEQLLAPGSNKNAHDAELVALSGMMDKILDIQHPQRVRERTSAARTATPGLQMEEDEVTISFLENNSVTGFASFSERSAYAEKPAIAIRAVIAEAQSVQNNDLVKIRLLEAFKTGGVVIPKGSIMFGKASFKDERLCLSVSSVRFNNKILPLALQAFDLDGLQGIHVTGAGNGSAADGVVEQGVAGLSLPGLDPSFKMEAARLGVDAAKRLIRSKGKKLKVLLPEGYQLYLQNPSL